MMEMILENPGDVENAGAGASVEAWQTRSGGFDLDFVGDDGDNSDDYDDFVGN